MSMGIIKMSGISLLNWYIGTQYAPFKFKLPINCLKLMPYLIYLNENK